MLRTRPRFDHWVRKITGEGIGYPLQCSWASLVAQTVKIPPAMHETWVRSLGWNDPLEKEIATRSSILAWRMPQRVNTTEQLSRASLVAQSVNEGDLASTSGFGRSPGGQHGNPLQNSCLENPMDRGAWQATVHRVINSWTQLSDQAQHSTASSCASWGLWQHSPSPPLLLWPSHLGLKSTVDRGA